MHFQTNFQVDEDNESMQKKNR